MRLGKNASLLLIFFFIFLRLYHAADTIKPTYLSEPGSSYSVSRLPVDSLSGKETLEKGVFTLGFFSTDDSEKYFLGIWVKDESSNKKAIIWVANRNNPLHADNSSTSNIVLHISKDDGNLILSDGLQEPMIINKGSPANSRNTSTTLLESGNLILTDEDGRLVWQSFDFPTNAFLPGMKIGRYRRMGRVENRFLVSWVGLEDPSPGDFFLGVAANDANSLSIWQGFDDDDGGRRINNIGSWDGKSFHLFFENLTDSYNFSYVSNQDEAYFTFAIKDGGYVFSWFVIEPNGRLDEYYMLNGAIMNETHSVLCNDTTSSFNDGTSRCFNLGPLPRCNEDKFLGINGTVPTTLFEETEFELKDCEIMCQSNCSCTAFALSSNDSAKGCNFYYGNKIHLLDVLEKGGPGLVYIRGDLGGGLDHGQEKKKPSSVIIYFSIIVPGLALIIIILLLPQCYFKWQRRHGKGMQAEKKPKKGWTRLLVASTSTCYNEAKIAQPLGFGLHKQKSREMFFTLSAIETATDNFAAANKLGEGGFGPVYKGQLPEGHAIAVKRLSKLSRQGVEEFKNEVTLISELQHRNLVKILGCCIEGDENMLIYEYMPNKSLDCLIFDSSKRPLLDWPKRMNIISGIAQGLLYLHKYSRLKIIHRDLKTSNILLDGEMNPKISDFGIARIFKDDEIQASTKKVVGTYGYMSPEYAMYGHFSEKSDVFSFGVILLEIISGQKNVAFCDPGRLLALPTKAVKLWKNGKSMEFVDSFLLASSCRRTIEDVIRCMKLGLMCVEERAEERPNMSDVVSALRNSTTDQISLELSPHTTEESMAIISCPEAPAVSAEDQRLSTLNGSGEHGSEHHLAFTGIHPR